MFSTRRERMPRGSGMSAMSFIMVWGTFRRALSNCYTMR